MDDRTGPPGVVELLHPPPGSGTLKRGPGRPRKENNVGLGWKTKNLHRGLPGPNRAFSGRKKSDGVLSAGGTNLAVSSLIGELSAISHESPPRGGNNGGDDAAESDTSSVASSLEKLHEDFSLLPEQWPGKVCAFCNLGERSMLGQGDLLRIEIPDGFDPVAVANKLTLKNKTEKDVNNDKAQKSGFSGRRQKGAGKAKRLISQSSLESMNEPVDEVCGYPEEPEYTSVFDSSAGYYYVHHGCANWCDGVTLKDDGVTFTSLEVELIRSLNQRCLHCGNLGAGVACTASNCGGLFHLPCAAISGAFQDPSSKTVLCSSHLDLVVQKVGDKANCTICNSPGKISALVLCSNCGQHYHASCLELNTDTAIRAGWQCTACKMCQACRQPGDEGKLLSCDTCDKSYHISCLRPALSSIPKHSWKCKLCRQCTDCGARTPGSGPSSRWHANFSVCDSCYQQRNKGLACPMCGKAYRHVAQKLMLQCHKCRKYVHGSCDPAADLSTHQQKKGQHPGYEYVCKPCKTNQPGLSALPGSAPRTLSSSLKRTSDELGEDGSNLGSNMSSLDNLFSPENASMQSTENSNDVLWNDKGTSGNSGEDKLHLHQTSHHQAPKDNKLLNYEAKLHKRKSISGTSGGGGRGKGHDRMGHYSTNSNNSRRHKVSELVKKRGPKPKLRMFGSGRVHRASTDSFPKEEEGQPVGVENRMILCSSRDDFVLQQDVCVMCGAYGNDLEGRLIACAQCGQCYHPYCVNVKVNRVILQKGWRCLDCTVCEGCGQRNDEARLILCDECDVSFHIYCMVPPLDSVPDGNWKCKWCVVCQYCGTNDPGKNSLWHNNYTTCGPCASYSVCPVCKAEYADGELIIKCNKCDRWIHAGCDSIKDDDDAEKCSDENYSCILCRPHEVLPPHLRPPPAPVTKAENPPKSPDLLRAAVVSEGVYLSEEGNAFIKSLTMDLYVPRDKRDKRRKKLKKRPISEMEAGILAVIESVVSGGAVEDKSREEKEDEENEKDTEERKRQKKLGIGGFVVRNNRGPRFKDEDDFNLDQAESGDKPKRKAQRRKPIKNKLVESFPVYLQEAFFGKPLLKPSSKETDLVMSSIDELEDSTSSFKCESTVTLTKEEIKEIEAIKAKQRSPEKSKPDNRQVLEQSNQHLHPQQMAATNIQKKLQPSLVDEDDSEMAFQDILTAGDLLDNDFMDNIMNEGDDIKVEDGLVDFGTGNDDSNDFSLDQTSQDVVNPKDEFNDILTSQFGLDNIDPGLPSMDSKDVEDIFKGVLIEESQEALFSQVNNVPAISEVASTPRVNSNQVIPPSSLPVSSPSSIPQNITTTCSVQASPGLPRGTPLQASLASPVNFPPQSPYPSEYSNSPQFSPAFSEPPSPWPQTTSEVDVDQPNSNNTRKKYEAEEALGPNATICSVLYANMNHPELKRDFPNWNERGKQITKIWRNLPQEKRIPYLEKAKENRAASRLQKSKQMPKENRVGDGNGIKDASMASHSSPECDSPHHVKGTAPPPLPLQAIIKTEMDIDSCCGPSPCGSHHGHESNMLIGPTDSPSMCYSSSPSYMHQDVSSYSRIHVACSSHSPTTSNSMSPHPPPSPHHPSAPYSLPPKPGGGTVAPPGGSSMPSPLYMGSGDKDSPHGPPPHPHKYSSYGPADHNLPHSSPHHHPHIRNLPTSESCNFSGLMDPDKMGSGAAKNARNVETQEERQWKQMQALRQQQQQQGVVPGPDQLGKEGVAGAGPIGMAGTPPGIPFTSSSLGGPRMMPPGSPGVVPAGMEGVRQALQGPLSPSPMGRAPFPGNLQLSRPRPPNMQVAMPPPSPSGVYPPRPEGVPVQNAQNIRGPLYARLPFQHQQPRQGMPQSMQNDVYGTAPPTPQPVDVIPQSPGGPSVLQDQYSHNSPIPQQQGDVSDALGASPRPSPSPQTPEAKQHLRGLLQRQIKTEQGLGQNEVPSQNRPPSSWAQTLDEAAKLHTLVTVDGQQLMRLGAPNKGMPGEFRQPLLPSHVRVPANMAQLSPGHPTQPGQRQAPPGVPDFRTGSPVMDPRARLILHNQQRNIILQAQQQGMPQQRPTGFNQFPPGSVPPSSPSPVRSPMEYDQLLQQQQQQQRISSGVSVSTSPMLAQQLGRPLSAGVAVSSPQLSPHHNMHSASAAMAAAAQAHHHQQQPSSVGPGTHPDSAPSSVSPAVTAAAMGDHQELPDSVTEELEKLEQEHNSEHGVEEPSELADLGMDDDELLGMGDDFNILEYADSELDDVGIGGEKTNILDNLDLEEDEKEEARKDEPEIKDGDKKEPSITSASTALTKVTDALSQASVSHMLSPSNPSYMHNASAGKPQPPHTSHGEQMLRPTQHQQPPPPPYPVPPPPYPGRPQMIGIRNAHGTVIPSLAGLRSPLAGLGGVVVGGGATVRPPSLASPPNANTHLHLTPPQRRTLLLQEQPLLLEDLLEQEKREQQKQLPPHAPGLMGAAPEEPFMSDFDFERLKADVLSSSNLPVSLSPPNLVANALSSQQPSLFIRTASGQLTQVHQTGGPPHWQVEGAPGNQQLVSQQPPHQPQVPSQQGPPPPPPGTMEVPHALGAALQGPPRMNLAPLPPPPNISDHTSSDQSDYEQRLYHQLQTVGNQLSGVQSEVDKLRKQRKTINSKQRQLKKTNSQLAEPDKLELERICSELPVLQKQLDQLRKQKKQQTSQLEDYQNKKQKKQQQQMMSSNPQSNMGPQMSPLGPSANSPLQHTSTPQSPMHMSSSPGIPGGPSPSPLMQHSPMASPLTPSPGPHSTTLSQTSPRVVVNPGQHGGSMEEMPFSPTNDPNMRPMLGGQMPQNIRIPVGGQVQMRMATSNVGSPGGHQQIIVQQPGGPNQNQPIMIVRGISSNMISMQHQQQMGRMRVMGPGPPSEQMKQMLAGQMGSPQRFQRVGLNQVKGPQQFPPNSMSGMPMSPAPSQQQHFAPGTRVPFPTQSPNAPTNMNMNMRSPSPMTPVGGLGSPPSAANQTSVMHQMVQNRVSPASSPMRRPSGSSSIGVPSPMPSDRPQSVENPMTPRSGSRPHTPIGSNVLQQQPQQQQQHQQQQQQQHGHMEGMNVVPSSHAPPTSVEQASQQFNMDVYSCAPPTPAPPSSTAGGGGGGQNHQILPFPTFSWSDGMPKMGLKGGSPFSVINESVQASNNNNSTSSNSVADSEVATQATTITVSTSSTELNNVAHSHLHGIMDGEGSSNTASPPSSVPTAAGSTTLANAGGSQTNSTTDAEGVLPTTSNPNDSVPVKSVLMAVSVSSAPAAALTNASASKSAPNAYPAASVASSTAPVVVSTSAVSKVDGNPTVGNANASSAPPTPVSVSNPTNAPATKPPERTPTPTTSSQDNLLTQNSAQAAVAAVVSSPGILINCTKESSLVPPASSVVVVSSVQAMVNSIAKVANAAAAASNAAVVSVSSTPATLTSGSSPANSHLGGPKPNPVSASSAFVVASTAQLLSSSPITTGVTNVLPPPPPIQQQQQIVRPNMTSVNLRPTVATLTLSSIPTSIPGVPVSVGKPIAIPVAVSSQQPTVSHQGPPPTVQISLGQGQLSGSAPVVQQVSLPQSFQSQQQQHQQLTPLLTASVVPSASGTLSSAAVSSPLAGIVRQPVVGTVSSSGTMASAVTFVPPTVTASPGSTTGLLPVSSVPSASYTSVVPSASVTVVTPSAMKPQPTPVAVGFTSVPFSTFPGAQQVHIASSSHGQPPTSATVIYTTHPGGGLRVTGTGNHPTSIQIPHHIPLQIQQQQPGGTVVHHTVPVMAANNAGGAGTVIINETGASINAMPNNAGAIAVSSSSTGAPAQGQQLTQQQQSQGESQNALLKQLLQNTACASMTQQSETVGFSLTSCLQSRPVNASVSSHTSHLSEQATRIPHPTPILRPTTPTTPVQTVPPTPAQIPLTRPTIKTEPVFIEECSQPSSTPLSATPPVVVDTMADIKPSLPEPVPAPQPQQPPPPPVVQQPPPPPPVQIPVPPPPPVQQPPIDPSKEAIIAVVQETAQNMQNHDSKLNDIISGVVAGGGEIPGSITPPMTISSPSSSSTGTTASSKKGGGDDDAKKLKRRQYAAKRKQNQANSKDTPTPSKKRPRKVGRPEDDFETFMENFLQQLRQLSPIGIVEPELSYNFNVCALAGVGDLSKLTQKNYSTLMGDLTGTLGRAQLPNKSDYYNTRPFGPDPPKPVPKPQPTHRGFYYQEFATPKMGTFEEKIRLDNRTPSPIRETNTPDTIVSASSPECTSWDNSNMYPGLKYIDEDMDRDLERCISPEMPLLAPIPIRPVPIDPKSKVELLLAREANNKDMDKENKNGFMKDVNGSKLRSVTPFKDAGNITVTLTLSTAAAEDIRGLLRNLANVLSIAAPAYQVIDKGGSGSSSSGSSTISEQKSHLYTIKGKDGKEKIDIQSILNGAAKFCRHCDVAVLNNVIRKKFSDFPGITPAQLNGGEEATTTVDTDFYFCSTTCLMQFSITHGITVPHEERAAAIVTHPGGDQLRTIKTENDGRLKVKNKLADSDGKGGNIKIKEEVTEDQKPEKRWKGTRYRTWGSAFLPPTRYKKQTDKEVTEMLFQMGITAMPSKFPLDTRDCIFCHLPGDGVSDGPGRLLNFDVDKWVHLNCALWSDDVYETENGALVNVELALKQSLASVCVFCEKKGATVKCFKTRCTSVYHLGCATKDGCIFYKNKTIYCPVHIPKGEKENELSTLSVYRRVYIQRDENKQVAAVMHHADQHHLLRVGSLIFLNVGQLLPHQLPAFHTPNFIYPIGYKIARFYWSMRKINKRCQYICSIHDVDGKPEFRVAAQEEGYKEHVVKASTAQAAWSQILETISRLRNCAEIIRVFPKYITGEDLFGLTEPSIVKVLESLPGIETLTDYHFKYGRNPLLELPLAINPTGCARSEPKLRTHFKRPQTQRTRPSRSSTLSSSTIMSSEAACPYSKQFVHSKSSQYKKMKQEWRNNVYLARSKIQGLGLYAARDIEKHTMVIEYIGEIIRPELAEIREKKYEAQNRGIYMFRLDENRVIDATLCGGLARYINHSCNPNCVAETVEVDRDLRIIIFANRRISRGEELSYDYKFEVEDDQHKIPCLCGAPNCQQWMN